MSAAKPSIFRSQALEHYIHSREKTILPRLVAPRVFLLFWLLLVLLAIVLLFAWQIRVPRFLEADGIVGKQNQQQEQSAFIFLAANSPYIQHLQAGMVVRLQIGEQGMITTTIEKVAGEVLSPVQVQQRYGLMDNGKLFVQGPVIVIWIKLTGVYQGQSYQGSRVHAQMQTGTTSILSLFLPLDFVIGDK